MEHLRPDRGHRGRLRRPADRDGPGADRATRSTAGTWPWSTSRGSRSTEGDVGELVIGGVGLARYLDPAQDAEKFAAAPHARLGPRLPQRRPRAARARRGWSSSAAPTTRSSSAAGGSSSARSTRRCRRLPGVAGAAAAVRTHHVGATRSWSATSPPSPGVRARPGGVPRAPAGPLPAALVPDARRGRHAADPHARARSTGTRCPWPLDRAEEGDEGGAVLPGTAGWLAEQWTRDPRGRGHRPGPRLLRRRRRQPRGRAAGVAAAGAVSRGHRGRRLRPPAARRPGRGPGRVRPARGDGPPGRAPDAPARAQAVQGLLRLPLAALVGWRWLVWLGALGNLAAATRAGALGGDRVLVVGADRLAAARDPARAGWARRVAGRPAAAARACARAATPAAAACTCGCGSPRRSRRAAGADNLPGAPWVTYYARALGATVGRDVDLHSMPPVTGLLVLGKGCAVEPEVDLSGHWLDGDVLHVGRVRVGRRRLRGHPQHPGARHPGRPAAPRSRPAPPCWPRSRRVSAGQGHRRCSAGPARHRWPDRRAPRGSGWVGVYGLTAALLACFPLVAAGCGLLVVWAGVGGTATFAEAAAGAARWLPLARRDRVRRPGGC